MTDSENNNQFPDTYGSLRPYRSVAYGTWKVGGARRLSEKSNRRKEGLSECTSLDANHNYMSNGNTERAASPFRYSVSAHNLNLSTKRSSNDVVTAESIRAQLEKDDCYSSSEYSQYVKQKSQEHLDTVSPLGNAPHRSMDALNDYYVNDSRPFTFDPTDRKYASLGRQKKHKCNSKPASVASAGHIGMLKMSVSTQNDLNSVGQMHKRTHSFDSATHFAIISSPSTSAVNTMKQEKMRKNSGGALRATKNFFKKMTTTLPRKLRKGSANGQYIDNFQAATSPFFEIRYPEPEEIPYLPYNIEYQLESESEETVAPDSSISHDEATNYSSTGSRVSDSESLALTNRQPSPEKFKSWNDLFVHLKKEITLMRERDAEILANLQSVEEGLRSVRHMDRSTSEHSHLGRRIRIGGPAQNTYI
ncbi:hypothetical protein QR680_000664 [Steinernema hermaphroditum]|uniref:Uncharacterized protein n=1 Tax=Steinernema hermaphroditum TaxID=289476 RepID=A0AA39GW45_9BILA|nr:hypothetical protein QR680_000664 [Steinernema hermaphroditum]